MTEMFFLFCLQIYDLCVCLLIFFKECIRGCSSEDRLRHMSQRFADLRGWVLVRVLVSSAGYVYIYFAIFK